MATKIIHKKSSVASSIPSAGDLEPGEIAVNLADKKLYSKTTGGTVIELAPNDDQLALTETCKNVSGGSLAIGTPVYQSGTAGNAMEVQKALSGTAASMPAVGLLSSTLADEAEGTIVLSGFLQGLNTSTFSEGDTLYVSSTGTLTTTIPAGEANLIQNIGKVIKVHASNGSIMVTGAGRANATPNLDDGNIFIGNASNQAVTASFNDTVDAHLNYSTATSGQVLSYNGSDYDWADPGTSPGIDDNATSTAVHINSGGDVGVGAVPVSGAKLYTDGKLVVDGTIDTGDAVFGRAGAEGGQITLRNPDGTSQGGVLDVSSTNELRLYQTANDSNMQIGQLSGTNGQIGFQTAGENRMLIDPTGNIGINTVSPQNALHVQDAGTDGAGTIKMGNNYHGYVQQNSNDLNIISNGDQAYRVGLGTNNGTGSIVFKTAHATTGNTERMRVTSVGHLLVGTVGDTLYNIVSGSGVAVRQDGEAQIANANNCFAANRTNAVDGAVLKFFKQGVGVGSISVTGSSTAYNTSSDYRLKTAVQPMTGASARVQTLKPVNFEWISSGERVDGFIAHELQEVVPEAATGIKDSMRDEEYEATPAVLDDDGNVVTEAVMGTRSVPDYQGIDQSKLVPLLTAALQEALTKINDMETRLAALEVSK
jgi:hypothetical protein